MIAIVGGKCDGMQSPVRTVTLKNNDGEEYLLISYKEGAMKGYFYMLAGMTPGDALKIHRDREAVRAGFEALP